MGRPRTGAGGAGALSLALAAAALLVHLPSLRNGFVWDDKQYLLLNPHVAGGLSAENLRWALTSFEAGNWHPLTWASHMLDVSLFGLAPWGHHLVNVLLHAGNALLLFGLLAGATGMPRRSFVVAALFAVHPLHVESVAWVAERKDLLSSCLGLLAAHAHLRHVRRPSAGRLAAAAALFALALAAKPMLVTLPFVLLLLEWWPLGRLRAGAWRRPVLEKAPLLVLAAASSAVTYAAQASTGAVSAYPLAARASNALVSYVRYLGKAALPVRLAAFYPHPVRPWPPAATLGAAAALAAATATALRERGRRPHLACGWLWYLGALVPVIGLVQVGQQALADRYTYLPLTGVFVAAVWTGAELAGRRPAWRGPLAGAAAAALVALGALSVVQTGRWRDPAALFGHAAAAAPGNWLAHYNLGLHYQELGRADDAVRQYREALAIRPDHAKSLNNLGVLLAARGDLDGAIERYRAAIRSAPEAVEAVGNLGAALLAARRFPEAEGCFREALRRGPDAVGWRVGLADALQRQGRAAEAAAEYAAALRLDPDAAPALNGLGVGLARQGRYAEAAERFRAALRADPGNADARANLARAAALAGR